MRFLLHPPKAIRLGKSKNLLPKPVLSRASHRNNTNNNQSVVTNRGGENVVTTFGQQCSPNCGCAIRFEAQYDNDTQDRRIQSMTYNTKTIISTVVPTNKNASENREVTLTPVYTASRSASRSGRPMAKDCNCPTVHSLSQQIVATLPGMTLSQAQNQLEFLGLRSSPSFRYTVLKNHNLINGGTAQQQSNHNSKIRSIDDIMFSLKEGKCYDLIEDALVACLNGYMPKPRKESNTFENRNSHRDIPIKSPTRFMEEIDKRESSKSPSTAKGLDPMRFVNAAKRRTEGIFFNSTSPNTIGGTPQMAPYNFVEGTNDEMAYETLSQLKEEISKSQEEIDALNEDIDDWLSYVDERETSEEG